MVRKLLIALVVLVVLFGVAVAGLSIFVKSYLKSDKLKALIIPRAEEFMNRDVDIGRIDVSLFKGIVVKDLLVKEEGRDFVRVSEFILAYDLLPLLRKKLVIKRVELHSPFISIIRFPDGSFNFSDIMQGMAATEPAETGEEEPAATGLPVTLVTDRVVLANARVEFVDKMKKLPNMTAEADAEFKVSLAEKFSAEGFFEIKELNATLRGVVTKTTGRVDIDSSTINTVIKIDIDGSAINLTANVKDYAANPEITFSLSANEIDMEKFHTLLGMDMDCEDHTGMSARMSAKKSARKPTGKSTGMFGAMSQDKGATEKTGRKPLSLKARGEIDIKKIICGTSSVEDLRLSGDADLSFGPSGGLPTGRVEITKLAARVKGIAAEASGRVELRPEDVTADIKAALALPGKYEYQDYSISDVLFKGDLNAAYVIKTSAATATVSIETLRATANGISVSTGGKINYDGKAASASLRGLKVSAAEYKAAGHVVRNLDMDADADLKYRIKEKTATGQANLRELKAEVNGVNVSATGGLKADSKKISGTLTIGLNGDRIKLTGSVRDYSGNPDIRLDLYSKKLDIERLMALTGGGDKQAAEAGKPEAVKRASAKPAKRIKVRAQGKLNVRSAIYREYSLKDILVKFLYADDVMTVQPVSLYLTGGKSIRPDGIFKGNLRFTYPLNDPAAVEIMKDTMRGRGTASLRRLEVSDLKVADALSVLTGLPELRSTVFEDSELNYEISDRKVNLDGQLNSRHILFTPKGFVGLDKSIDMQAVLWLSPVLTQRLIITQFTQERDGSSTLPLTIKGTVEDPSVKLDVERIIKKGLKQLFEGLLPGNQNGQEAPAEPAPTPDGGTEPEELDPVKLFKGIFDR